MTSINGTIELIEVSTRRDDRRVLLETLTALQRELAALDKLDFASRQHQYDALTLRFSNAASGLKKAKAKAEEMAAQINAAASIIGALTTLIGVL